MVLREQIVHLENAGESGGTHQLLMCGICFRRPFVFFSQAHLSVTDEPSKAILEDSMACSDSDASDNEDDEVKRSGIHECDTTLYKDLVENALKANQGVRVRFGAARQACD
jgi:hypothetical protein